MLATLGSFGWRLDDAQPDTSSTAPIMLSMTPFFIMSFPAERRGSAAPFRFWPIERSTVGAGSSRWLAQFIQSPVRISLSMRYSAINPDRRHTTKNLHHSLIPAALDGGRATFI